MESTTPTITFRKFYQQMPDGQKEQFRNDVCKICGFSIASFYTRVRGCEDLFSPAEKTAIAKLVNKTEQEIFAAE